MMRVRQVVAWVFMVGGVIGSVLSVLGIIGKGEPQLVLQLSWFALIYSGFNGVQIVTDAK